MPENMTDAISKRTRARYSLADMSLDQLEMFLQESDEEDYFHNLDDAEEYRKFLVAVQGSGCPVDLHRSCETKKEEDDDDEDGDFEIDIEEALKTHDACQSLRKRKPRRANKGNVTCTGHLHAREPPGQSIRRIRHLLPHADISKDEGPVLDEMPAVAATQNLVWMPIKHNRTPVNGFTAHQIGQLYCLIHEHVQLLVQVFSLCILEPSRQQMASNTHAMLMELVEKRELLLSWKKTAFPDFCFRSPYTHPSLIEAEINQSGLSTSKTSCSFLSSSISTGQTNRASSTICTGYLYPQGSVSNLSYSNEANSDHSSSVLVSSSIPTGHKKASINLTTPSLLSSPVMEPASLSTYSYNLSEDLSQPTDETSQSLQTAIHAPVSSINNSQPTPRKDSVYGGPGLSPSPLTQCLNATSSSPAVDAYHSLLPKSLKSPSNLTETHSLPKEYTGPCLCPGEIPVQQDLLNPGGQSNPSELTAEDFPPATAETAMPFPPSTATPAFWKSHETFPCQKDKYQWAPVTSGPVRSLLDVAPLALVRDFLVDVYRVVEDYRKGYVETGAYHNKFERKPLFVMAAVDNQEYTAGTISDFLGSQQGFHTHVLRPQMKKTMAAALVESTIKQSLALVPRDAAIAVERFLPYFNKALFPHRPPPVATASRLLFTDAEDELLAMGLMIYNTDWKAIQQRFLPSKSMHQIFVRQKNRSSARAPENSIKAIRRMKSSPLTSSEKSSIQEGLGLFKYDWNKVWQYCVPHRDPSVLPRQWRIAVGTQKSYKTSETSKERRRVYEANRRQLIAAKKASDKYATLNQDFHPSCSEKCVEPVKMDSDNGDKSCIREAFLADWSPRKIPDKCRSVVSTGIHSRFISPLSRKRKAKVELEVHLSEISPWCGAQAVKTICQTRKQTVKLAPGLPSVKLPPCVHVLTKSHVQAHQPFQCESRLRSVNSPWNQISQPPEKLGFLVGDPDLWAPSLSDYLKEASAVGMNVWKGGHPSRESIVSSTHCIYRKAGQTIISLGEIPPVVCNPNGLSRLTTPSPTEVSNQASGSAQSFPPAGKSETQYLVWQRVHGSNLANDMSLPSIVRDPLTPFLQHGHSKFYEHFVDTADTGLGSIEKFKTLPIHKRSKRAHALKTKQFGSNYATRITLPISSIAHVVTRRRGHYPLFSTCPAASTRTSMHHVKEVELCSLPGTIQGSSSMCVSETELPWSTSRSTLPHSKAMRSGNVITACSWPQTKLAKANIVKRNLDGCAGQRGVKASRSASKMSVRLFQCCEFTKNFTGSRLMAVEHILDAASVSGYQDGNAKSVSPSSKFQNLKGAVEAEALIKSDQHLIVMEEEELGDSDDEAGTGFQFEREEIDDSDIEGEIELHSVKNCEAH